MYIIVFSAIVFDFCNEIIDWSFIYTVRYIYYTVASSVNKAHMFERDKYDSFRLSM